MIFYLLYNITKSSIKPWNLQALVQEWFSSFCIISLEHSSVTFCSWDYIWQQTNKQEEEEEKEADDDFYVTSDDKKEEGGPFSWSVYRSVSHASHTSTVCCLYLWRERLNITQTAAGDSRTGENPAIPVITRCLIDTWMETCNLQQLLTLCQFQWEPSLMAVHSDSFGPEELKSLVEWVWRLTSLWWIEVSVTDKQSVNRWLNSEQMV